MPNQESTKFVAAQTGDKHVADQYDDYCGRYVDVVGPSRISAPKPAKDTKRPFGALTGGK